LLHEHHSVALRIRDRGKGRAVRDVERLRHDAPTESCYTRKGGAQTAHLYVEDHRRSVSLPDVAGWSWFGTPALPNRRPRTRTLRRLNLPVSVEDRTSPGVWLELVSADQGSYPDRARELVSRPGVWSAWWGANANPGREDLPRKILEFSTLGVYEVCETFSPPAIPEGTTGLHFKRTSRPGQGVLTGAPTTGVLLVLVSPRTVNGAASLRDWADFVHIRHIAEVAVPGYSMITPYESADGSDPRFLHLYEMDSADPEATFASMVPLVERRLGPQGSKAFDAWARHVELRIMYVNTFRRTGAIPPSGG
jgi:hypothetical protein